MNNGPTENRECTDLICCLVFLAFIVGMVGVSGYGLVYGEPELMLTMWDADKKGCGYSPEVKDYPYLYFPIVDIKAARQNQNNLEDAVKELLRFGTCVKECPTAEGPVECHKTAYMSTDPMKVNFDKPCIYAVKWTICPEGKDAECA